MKIDSIADFNSLSPYQKTLYFDNNIADAPSSFDKIELYSFIKTIVKDDDNPHIRVQALKSLVEFILLKKLDVRHGLSVLIDDWNKSENTFLELERCKSLFYFFEYDEPQVLKELQKYSDDTEHELAGEGSFQLGKVNLLKSFQASNFEDFEYHLRNSIKHFKESTHKIENRTDARFYELFGEILLKIKNQKFGRLDVLINRLSEIVFQREVYSFEKNFNEIFISLLKSTSGLKNILIQNPTGWIDFKNSLDKVYFHYCEIHNNHTEIRLQNSPLKDIFINAVGGFYLEPYFALSFDAEKVKLNKVLSNETEGSDKYNFVNWIISSIENGSLKKKASANLVKEQFKKIYSDKINPSRFEKATKNLDNDSTPLEILSVFEQLTKPDQDILFRKIILASLELQGNKRFWKDEADEDERNTFICSILRAAGENARDQALWSASYAGQQSGEIDILITTRDEIPLSFIEALNLDSVNKAYIKLHLEKIFKYDTSGVENNYILVYYTANNFSSFFPKYFEYITNFDYKYPLESITEIEIGKTDIAIKEAQHTRNHKKTLLTHIVIDLGKE